ncbi:MAG: hypothetical protein ACK440_08105 [Sphingomonadaceae bacterium]|jgi:hypothetical protein
MSLAGVLAIMLNVSPALPSAADPLILLGENTAGRQIFIDPASLKSLPAIANRRPFPTLQLFVVMRGPANKGSVERVRYSFSCRARTAAALSYFRTMNGIKSHDWRAADVPLKYQPVAPGGLVEMALTYACNGGKLPENRIKPAPARSEDEAKDEDGGG